MKFTTDDAAHMLRALGLAEGGRGAVEPNPCVGAVLVKDGRIVGTGFHGRFGGPHAEVEAIRSAGADARGATLYVSLEPCSHYGKTPPCVDAVRAAGIAEVVAAAEDPNPLVRGCGFRALQKARVRVRWGLLGEEAERLNRGFFHWHRTGRPYVTAKWAMTLDGKVATDAGDSKWVTSDGLRERMREERGRYQAILVGVGTVLADDPRLRSPRPILRVVLDSRLRMKPTSRLACSGTVVFCDPSARGANRLERRGVEIVRIAPRDTRRVVAELGERGTPSILVEGGPTLHSSFFAARLVNETIVCIAAKVAGGRRSAVAPEGVPRMSKAWAARDPRIEIYGDELVVRSVVR